MNPIRPAGQRNIKLPLNNFSKILIISLYQFNIISRLDIRTLNMLRNEAKHLEI